MSYRNNALRLCRANARASCTAEGYTNTKIQVKTVKSGKLVMNEVGVYVEEVVPVTTFTSVHKPNSYKAIYKEAKNGL